MGQQPHSGNGDQDRGDNPDVGSIAARRGSGGRVEGALAVVSMTIRENGTGEIIFPLGGARRCSGARTADGKAIEKGAEVVIEKYEKGIAYVKRWEEFVGS